MVNKPGATGIYLLGKLGDSTPLVRRLLGEESDTVAQICLNRFARVLEQNGFKRDECQNEPNLEFVLKACLGEHPQRRQQTLLKRREFLTQEQLPNIAQATIHVLLEVGIGYCKRAG